MSLTRQSLFSAKSVMAAATAVPTRSRSDSAPSGSHPRPMSMSISVAPSNIARRVSQRHVLSVDEAHHRFRQAG